jgi:hypothetical protein
MITVIQNFVINHPERLRVFSEGFPKMAEVLGDYKFLVNYDSPNNVEAVKNLYEKYNLNYEFSHNLNKNTWASQTYSMVEKATTDYVYYMMEDSIFHPTIADKTMFKDMLEDFISDDCKHLQMGKVGKYAQSKLYEGRPHKTYNWIRTFTPNNNPCLCAFSLVAIWEKNLFMHLLSEVPPSSPIKEMDTFERNTNQYRHLQLRTAAPTVALVDHTETKGLKDPWTKRF